MAVACNVLVFLQKFYSGEFGYPFYLHYAVSKTVWARDSLITDPYKILCAMFGILALQTRRDEPVRLVVPTDEVRIFGDSRM